MFVGCLVDGSHCQMVALWVISILDATPVDDLEDTSGLIDVLDACEYDIFQ